MLYLSRPVGDLSFDCRQREGPRRRLEFSEKSIQELAATSMQPARPGPLEEGAVQAREGRVTALIHRAVV